MNKYQVIGHSVPRIDAREKITGKAIFASDFKLPGMLYGKVLRSPYPHARILNIDTSAAERLPGVKTVVTAKDTLQVKYGPMIPDEQVLAVDKVRYIGDEIAIVAAVDEDTAEEALQLIKVEYDLLPAVFDPELAILEGAPLVHEAARNLAVSFTVNQGDVEEGFRQSDCIYEDRYQTPLVHQCYLEPITVVANYTFTGDLTIWAASQEPFIARHEIAQVLGMPESKVRIIQPYGGGGFGGKCDQKLLLVAAVLAKQAMAPIRLANTRAEEFYATRPRLPMVFYMKTGVKRDGTLMAKEVRVIADNGAYSSQGPPTLSVAAIRSDSLYRFKNVRTEASLVYTNKVPTGAFRGFGNPQAHFALESHLDAIAYQIGMDPIELRLKNATQKGDVTAHGWRMDSCGLSECIHKVADAAGWQEKRGPKEGLEPGKVRGIGAACMIHVSGNRSVCNEYDGSSAFVQIHLDGRVTVLCGDPDIGQG
ncbi:MAG: molybdopterin cofactor-binding domain-containing protein, partial [Dehalobacterium sp.]